MLVKPCEHLRDVLTWKPGANINLSGGWLDLFLDKIPERFQEEKMILGIVPIYHLNQFSLFISEEPHF
jgi:hypothetical protein